MRMDRRLRSTVSGDRRPVVCWQRPLPPSAAIDRLLVMPERSRSPAPTARQPLIVEARRGEDFVGEATAGVEWSSSDPKVVAVKDGVAAPVGNGTAKLTAKIGSQTATAEVTVAGSRRACRCQLPQSGAIGAREVRLQFRGVPWRGGREERLQAIAPRLRCRCRLVHDHAPSPRAADCAERSGPKLAAC